MLDLDPESEFGARVMRRLREETIAWLTTVDRTGTPRSVPIWFYWDGDGFLVYSQPNRLKLRNIERNPRVSLHFQADEWGEDVVTFTGEARVVTDVPPAHQFPEFVDKYRAGLEHINWTPKRMGNDFTVAIRIVPDRVSGE